jgi:hypothetical protein
LIDLFFLHFRKLNSSEFTVPYLSPFVVRKEIENIIVFNNNDNHDFINSKFLEEHSVIYWNLIWYFKRIGVDSGYLMDILLNDRINILKNQLEIQIRELKFLTNFQNKISKPYHKHNHVRLNCMWDNLKLQNSIKNYEIPIYLSYLVSGNLNDKHF